MALQHAFARQLSIKSAHGTADFEEVAFVDGVENPPEEFPNIVHWLVKHDYSHRDIRKLPRENVMRDLEEVWWKSGSQHSQKTSRESGSCESCVVRRC